MVLKKQEKAFNFQNVNLLLFMYSDSSCVVLFKIERYENEEYRSQTQLLGIYETLCRN
jgi:hypothetical protein